MTRIAPGTQTTRVPLATNVGRYIKDLGYIMLDEEGDPLEATEQKSEVDSNYKKNTTLYITFDNMNSLPWLLNWRRHHVNTPTSIKRPTPSSSCSYYTLGGCPSTVGLGRSSATKL
jgi:hypothetical protein